MVRTAASIAAFFLSLAALAAPAPKDKPASYYPVADGDKRVYERTVRVGGDDNVTEFTELTAVAPEADGGLRVTRRREGPGVARESEYRVTDKGVFWIPEGSGGASQCMLKFPLKVGDTWEEPPIAGGVSAKTKYTVAAEEDVKVPAGKFKAMRVDTRIELPGLTFETSTWYFPGVGVVKHRYTSGTTECVQELKSFSMGK